MQIAKHFELSSGTDRAGCVTRRDASGVALQHLGDLEQRLAASHQETGRPRPVLTLWRPNTETHTRGAQREDGAIRERMESFERQQRALSSPECSPLRTNSAITSGVPIIGRRAMTGTWRFDACAL
ncbi:hypothetical protein RRG08_040303 [Elysia crispata]|uniref:Uncharacterized protein n=1 Tax=Elysia crispata TaxID=231223 RepID=A0AAE0Z4D7_9GAST|nr:hypothetical protein RRG08_040303 [Elysia crispata]